MPVLASPNHFLQIVLAGAKTTNQLKWSLDYDLAPNTRTGAVPQKTIYGSTDDTTAVSMIAGPGAGAAIITGIQVANTDTAQATVTISLVDANNPDVVTTLVVQALNVNSSLTFNGASWTAQSAAAK